MSERLNKKALHVLALILYALVFLVLAYFSQAALHLVFIGLLPVLFHLIFFSVFLHKELDENLLWISPILFSALFYLASLGGVLRTLDVEHLAVFNVLAAYVINALLAFMAMLQQQHVKTQQRKYHTAQRKTVEKQQKKQASYLKKINALQKQLQEAKKETITKEHITISLRSIEDKCKSINFVVGRVYGKRKGGTKAIRDLLRIDSKLYNAFSEITQDLKEEDYDDLLHVLKQLQKKLKQFEKREKDILDMNSITLTEKVKRDPQGNDLTKDVLAKNDKDPFMDYYQEATEVCEKVMRYLTKHT